MKASFPLICNRWLGLLTCMFIFTGCFGYENPGAPYGINLYSVYYPAAGFETNRDLEGMSSISNSRLPDAPSGVGYLRTIYYSREPSSIRDEEVFAIAVDKLRNKIKRLDTEHPVLMSSKAPFDFVQIRLFRVATKKSSSPGEYSLLVIVAKSELFDPGISAEELFGKAKVINLSEKDFNLRHQYIDEHFRRLNDDVD